MLSAARLPQVSRRSLHLITSQLRTKYSSSNCPNHVRRTKSSIKKRIIVRRTVRSIFGEQTFAQLGTSLKALKTRDTTRASGPMKLKGPRKAVLVCNGTLKIDPIMKVLCITWTLNLIKCHCHESKYVYERRNACRSGRISYARFNLEIRARSVT